MTPGNATLIFLFPLVAWLVLVLLLLVQVSILYLAQTRVATGVLDQKLSSYLAAMGAMAMLYLYDKEFVAPLVGAMFPQAVRRQAETSALIGLFGFSLLASSVAFHYSMNVTAF